VLRVYKKFNISSINELRERLESGEIEKKLGIRITQHVRQGITQTQDRLLYTADGLRSAIEEYLIDNCRVRRAEVAGDYRRRHGISLRFRCVGSRPKAPSIGRVAGIASVP
jgi:hypothetical protein